MALAIVIKTTSAPNVVWLRPERFTCSFDAQRFLRRTLREQFNNYCNEIGEHVDGFVGEIVGGHSFKWKEDF